jgi:hypothetical protein
MERHTPLEVQSDFSQLLKDMEFLIDTISTQKNLTSSGYIAQFGTINRELIELWFKIDYLIVAESSRRMEKPNLPNKEKSYTKAYEEIRKILLKMLDTNKIETRHGENIFFFWEHIHQNIELRKDLINHFKEISKELLKTQKRI